MKGYLAVREELAWWAGTFAALAAIGLLVSSCDQSGPALTSECRDGATIELTVHVLADENEVAQRAAPFDIVPERGQGKLLGFATQVKGTNRHSLYVTLPRGQNDHQRIETWGHELMHAICGDWHR